MDQFRIMTDWACYKVTVDSEAKGFEVAFGAMEVTTVGSKIIELRLEISKDRWIAARIIGMISLPL